MLYLESSKTLIEIDTDIFNQLHKVLIDYSQLNVGTLDSKRRGWTDPKSSITIKIKAWATTKVTRDQHTIICPSSPKVKLYLVLLNN